MARIAPAIDSEHAIGYSGHPSGVFFVPSDLAMFRIRSPSSASQETHGPYHIGREYEGFCRSDGANCCSDQALEKIFRK
jgi:hypothetical protein